MKTEEEVSEGDMFRKIHAKAGDGFNNKSERNLKVLVDSNQIIFVAQTECTVELEDTLFYLSNIFNSSQEDFGMIILTSDSPYLQLSHRLQLKPNSVIVKVVLRHMHGGMGDPTEFIESDQHFVLELTERGKLLVEHFDAFVQ